MRLLRFVSIALALASAPGCSEPVPHTPPESLRSPQPADAAPAPDSASQADVPAPPDFASRLPPGFTYGEQTDYRAGGMGGTYAPLYRDGTLVDTVEVYVGVQQARPDTVLFQPVRPAGTDPDFGPRGLPQRFTLLEGDRRRALGDVLPFVDDGFSSPSAFDGHVYYWAMDRDENWNVRLLAARYDVGTARLDTTFLETHALETDNTGYLGPPYRDGGAIVFERARRRWLLDPVGWTAKPAP